MDINQMMQQAQKMQADLAQAQEEVHNMEFTATAGGGMVEATARGDNTLARISINPDAIDPNDAEMLEDMVVAAVNEALRGVSAMAEERLASVTGGIDLAGLL